MVTPNELIRRSEEQLGNGNKQEALATAIAATHAAPHSSDAWWQLALVRDALGDARNAIPPLRKTVELEDVADGAWGMLGQALFEIGEIEDAKFACLKALSLNDGETTALEAIIAILAKEDIPDDDEKTISFLERLDSLKGLSQSMRHTLGNLHYRTGHPLEAIENWKSIWSDKSAAFNVGLGFSHAKVSQDLDAFDIYTHLTIKYPEYDLPKNQLARLSSRLADLGNKCRERKPVYLSRVPYENYICPVELLNLDEAMLDGLDERRITALKKRVLNEIDLEDGKVSWVPDLTIDKSRAIATVEALIKDEHPHVEIFKQPSLRRFLTHGDIEIFTIGAKLDAANIFEKFIAQDGARNFLGKYFVPQFDRCLTMAIESRDLVVLECLLDGRRWVAPEQDDLCFEGGRRAVKNIIDALNERLTKIKEREPTLEEVLSALSQDQMIEILNFLPLHFEDMRAELVGLIRSLCVDLFNEYDNAELSKAVLREAEKINFRSARISELLAKDNDQLDEIIAKQRANEVSLTLGSESLSIAKYEVRRGERVIRISDIDSFRCGTVLKSEGGKTKASFLMSFRSAAGVTVAFNWNSKEDLDVQKSLFDRLLTAALSYVVPGLVDRWKTKILNGSELVVGPCLANRHGIQFNTDGWFRTIKNNLSWSVVEAEMKAGHVRVFDKANPKTSVSIDMLDVDNAMVLLFLIKNGELR